MTNQKGFTLVELMIVVGVIGILAAVAIPKFDVMLNRARYEKNGHWDANYKGDKSAFKGSDGRWFAVAQSEDRGQSAMDRTQPALPTIKPSPTPALDPVEFKELTRRDITYYYDSRSRLCFAQMSSGIVVVPCSSLGMK